MYVSQRRQRMAEEQAAREDDGDHNRGQRTSERVRERERGKELESITIGEEGIASGTQSTVLGIPVV